MTTPDPDATARQESGETPFTPRPRGTDVQFAPGTIIAGRYRIASILGSGGMGEVYRADDIKLDQPVALKFLPARLARDPMLLGRLHDEVRLGRQIAHPNVCRIYDIVDADGAHFVSMEFVDGEDLSRLLRRIGRLAHDKAVDIARGIAAGLMAAHAKGILHRDLKPANVMIDSHGDARIMDFGLALGAGEDDGTISGTPAYMAPEQLAGTPATVQSDLYALGLVMYELFTGKRAHNARTLPERVREISSEITTPSSVIRDIDPLVERVILRCLSHDSAQRPKSARQVIDALPGGDPLAAALAAGETPSPKVVAAAGAEGSLKPWQAWTMLGTIAALLIVFIALRSTLAITRFTKLELPPEVLRQRATDILTRLDSVPEQSPNQQTFPNLAFLAWLSERKDPKRWDALKNGPGVFRYRMEFGPPPSLSRLLSPSVNGPGWATIEVDQHGRLFYLLRAPHSNAQAKPVDWRPLLDAAGLDAASLQSVPPKDVPLAPFDARAAWSGHYPNDRTEVRVEAAAWQGAPVAFRITGAWDEETGAVERALFGGPGWEMLMLVGTFVIVGIAIFLAWRNLRLRRGDRAGALRVGAAVFLFEIVHLLLEEVSFAGIAAVPGSLSEMLGRATVPALILFVLYIALEPYARRRWPQQMIAWARLIGGSPRDPLVGRHILIGLIGGILHALFANSTQYVAAEFVAEAAGPLNFNAARTLIGIPAALAEVAAAGSGVITWGCVYMIILVLFTMIFRKRGLAAAALFALSLFFFYLALGHQPATIPSFIGIAALQTLLAVRWGALAIGVFQASFMLIFNAPFAPGASWVTPLAAIPLLVVIAVAIWAFITSLGGHSPFNTSLLDE